MGLKGPLRGPGVAAGAVPSRVETPPDEETGARMEVVYGADHPTAGVHIVGQPISELGWVIEGPARPHHHHVVGLEVVPGRRSELGVEEVHGQQSG